MTGSSGGSATTSPSRCRSAVRRPRSASVNAPCSARLEPSWACRRPTSSTRSDDEATFLLRTTSQTLDAIAAAVGYQNASTLRAWSGGGAAPTLSAPRRPSGHDHPEASCLPRSETPGAVRGAELEDDAEAADVMESRAVDSTNLSGDSKRRVGRTIPGARRALDQRQRPEAGLHPPRGTNPALFPKLIT